MSAPAASANPIYTAGQSLWAGGTLLGGAGQIYSGNAAYAVGIGRKQAADYQAQSAQERATQAAAAGSSRAQIARLNSLYMLSAQRAAAAGMGGTSTSTSGVSLMGQTAARSEYNALAGIYSGKEAALGYQNQAALDVYTGQQAVQAGQARRLGSVIGAGASVFSGLGQIGAGPFAMKYGGTPPGVPPMPTTYTQV